VELGAASCTASSQAIAMSADNKKVDIKKDNGKSEKGKQGTGSASASAASSTATTKDGKGSRSPIPKASEPASKLAAKERTAGMKAASGEQYGAILLKNQYRELCKNPVDGFSVGLADDDNFYEWKVMMQGPIGTPYEGGMFPCSLTFPREYPNKPPIMRFLTPGFWHPNVYPDGKVCISILHEPKEDMYNQQEKMSEKWRPILGIEAVLVSVMSLLGDANFESPANIEASVECRRDPIAYRRRLRQLVRKSQEAL